MSAVSKVEEIIERISSICNKSANEVRVALEGNGMHIRVKLLELLLEHGALRFNSLHRELGVFKGTLKWHLSKLERAGIVASFRFRNSRYIYIKGLEFRLVRKLISEYVRKKKPDLIGLLKDLCFSEDIDELARKYDVEVEAVRALKEIVVSAFGNVKGDDCRVLLQLMALLTSIQL